MNRESDHQSVLVLRGCILVCRGEERREEPAGWLVGSVVEDVTLSMVFFTLNV